MHSGECVFSSMWLYHVPIWASTTVSGYRMFHRKDSHTTLTSTTTSLPSLAPSRPLVTSDLYFDSRILSLQKCYINGTTIPPRSRISWASMVHFVSLFGTPWHGCAVVCLTTCLPKHSWAVSRLGLLWIKLLWTFMFRFFSEHMCFSETWVLSWQEPLKNLTYLLVIASTAWS